MPLVRVSRRRGRPAAENQALLDAVHDALVEAFKIPDRDRHQQLLELPPEHFEIPTGRSEAFTLVEITAFPGRSRDAKRALFQAMARRFESAGVSPADQFVVLLEPPLENWSPRNGVSSADAQPAFKLDV
ncbi:MAG: tautomerase family protein [Pseudomonadota bacterium]